MARVTASGRELEAVGPRAVLDRGFSITRLADGRLVRSAGAVKAGQRLATELADGRIDSRVEGAEAARDAGQKPAKTRKESNDPDSQERDQLGLF